VQRLAINPLGDAAITDPRQWRKRHQGNGHAE
jgi:hypothetical protein